jgi:hypothetical protein|tara:strand:+ start:524 stop:2161 length:1638 start_codon:yes stop_codon:yes gene_type:complete
MATLTQSAKSTSKSNQDKNNSGQSAADTQSSTLVDNRPATLAQMKIADGMGNGPRANKIAQLQSMMAGNATMQKAQDEEEVQMKAAPIQKMENSTGLPDNLKSGVEKLSGESLNDVQVHRNSDQPAQMQAHAFAQGNQIHVAPGQEKHLPHEAWHVAQQKQGRVKPTTQMKGQIPVNDDKGLEHEADVMGAKALQKGTLDKPTQLKSFTDTDLTSAVLNDSPSQNTPTLQHKIDTEGSAVIGGDLKEAEEVVNSFSFGIPNAFKAEVEYNETTKEGKIEIGDSEDGKAFKGFAGQGTIEKEKEGPGWKGQISVSLPKTPEVKTPEVELPIPPIPTGIPGLWVQIGLSAQASASVGLAANVGFELDENKAPKKLSILSGTIEPKASAEATAKLTADLGVPGVATVGAGIYGTAKAELSSSLNMGLDIEKGLYATGEVAGGLTGEIGALVEAKVLGYNIASYKRPLFEKEVAKFKTVLNVSLNATEFVNALRPSKDSVKANANVKGDSVDAAASGDPNKIDDAAAEPKAQEANKKTGIISWLRSKFN